jgi:hypothetical protein
MSVNDTQDDTYVIDTNVVDQFFSLSYASFLVIPRVVMQSMPREWQQKIVDLIHDMEETFDFSDVSDNYFVQQRNENGTLRNPDLGQYRHANVEHLRIKK